MLVLTLGGLRLLWLGHSQIPRHHHSSALAHTFTPLFSEILQEDLWQNRQNNAGIVKHYFLFGTLSIFLGCSFHVCSFIIDYCLSFKTPQQTRTILINYFPNIYDQNHLHLQPCVHSGDGSWGYITMLRTTIPEIRWDTLIGDSAAKINIYMPIRVHWVRKGLKNIL